MPRLSDDSKFEFRASKNSVAAEFQSMVCNTASTTKSRLHLHASSQNFFCPFSRKTFTVCMNFMYTAWIFHIPKLSLLVRISRWRSSRLPDFQSCEHDVRYTSIFCLFTSFYIFSLSLYTVHTTSQSEFVSPKWCTRTLWTQFMDIHSLCS